MVHYEWSVRTYRTTMTGTGECDTQYRETLPMPGAPSAAPKALNAPVLPRKPTTSESGRYRAIIRSIVLVMGPATNSTTTDNYEGLIVIGMVRAVVMID